jgi:hypothetical protein
VCLEGRERIVAAITGAVAAYVAETDNPVMVAIPRRKRAPTSDYWARSGRDEMMRMRMLWQRRIVPRLPISSYWLELKP